MKDYIEREQAITVFKTFYGKSLRVVLDALREEHAADVRPVVRGKWHSRFYYRESTKSYDCEMHVCSECGSEWSYDAETGVSEFNYCPNCGADMRGESDV